MTYISEITITTIITEEYYTWKRKQKSPKKNPDMSICSNVPQSGDYVIITISLNKQHRAPRTYTVLI